MSELGDLLELLHGARGRWRTVRLMLHEWIDLDLSARAFEREAERERRRGVGVSRMYAFAGGERPRIHESRVRVWLDPPDRVREEHEGEHPRTVAIDGDTWWSWSPPEGLTTNGGDPQHRHGSQMVTHLLDPAQLLGALDLEPAGSGEAAGRAARLVRARPRDVEPGFAAHRLGGLGADEILLAVDAERGVVLRSEARIDGEPFRSEELEEIEFDVELPRETFRLEVPGEEPVDVRDRFRRRELPLDEVARRATFRVFAPRVATGWRLSAHLGEASARPPAQESVHLLYHDVFGTRHFYVNEAAEPPRQPVAPDARRERVERGGLELELVSPAEGNGGAQRCVALERDGTHVLLHSDALSLDELVELALALEPAPTEPPRFVE